MRPKISCAIEQVPERDNRVTLVPDRDALGVPKVRVHWTVGEAEERTYRRAVRKTLTIVRQESRSPSRPRSSAATAR